MSTVGSGSYEFAQGGAGDLSTVAPKKGFFVEDVTSVETKELNPFEKGINKVSKVGANLSQGLTNVFSSRSNLPNLNVVSAGEYGLAESAPTFDNDESNYEFVGTPFLPYTDEGISGEGFEALFRSAPDRPEDPAPPIPQTEFSAGEIASSRQALSVDHLDLPDMTASVKREAPPPPPPLPSSSNSVGIPSVRTEDLTDSSKLPERSWKDTAWTIGKVALAVVLVVGAIACVAACFAAIPVTGGGSIVLLLGLAFTATLLFGSGALLVSDIIGPSKAEQITALSMKAQEQDKKLAEQDKKMAELEKQITDLKEGKAKTPQEITTDRAEGKEEVTTEEPGKFARHKGDTEELKKERDAENVKKRAVDERGTSSLPPRGEAPRKSRSYEDETSDEFDLPSLPDGSLDDEELSDLSGEGLFSGEVNLDPHGKNKDFKS